VCPDHFDGLELAMRSFGRGDLKKAVKNGFESVMADRPAP